MYWYRVAVLPVRWRNKCLATSNVEVLLNVNGTRLDIFHERPSITYCCSFSSAAFFVSGTDTVIGSWSLYPRGLWVTVIVCIVFAPFFSSLWLNFSLFILKRRFSISKVGVT